MEEIQYMLECPDGNLRRVMDGCGDLYILGLQDPSGALRADVRAVVYADPAVRHCIRRSYPGGAYGEGYDQEKSDEGGRPDDSISNYGENDFFLSGEYGAVTIW